MKSFEKLISSQLHFLSIRSQSLLYILRMILLLDCVNLMSRRTDFKTTYRLMFYAQLKHVVHAYNSQQSL